jgi:hypothetical protein
MLSYRGSEYLAVPATGTSEAKAQSTYMILAPQFELKFDRSSLLRARESKVNDDRPASKCLPACPQTVQTSRSSTCPRGVRNNDRQRARFSSRDLAKTLCADERQQCGDGE